MSRIFSKVLTNRLKTILESEQPQEQAGFRSGFSTIDHLHTINQVIEKSNEYGKDHCMVFIDYTKAFDSVNHNYILRALQKQGISDTYLILIASMYTDLRARLVTDIKGEYFSIEKGVKQGDSLSPIIFNATLEQIFRNLNWEGRGINVNGNFLSNLRFADDIVLVSETVDGLQLMVEELGEAGKEAGLIINLNKTKTMIDTPKKY